MTDLSGTTERPALSDEEVSGFVACLFDKDPPTARAATVPVPYCTENSPPSMRIFTFFNLLSSYD
jgi:hypothetical protein